jgi:hypothetical protein
MQANEYHVVPRIRRKPSVGFAEPTRPFPGDEQWVGSYVRLKAAYSRGTPNSDRRDAQRVAQVPEHVIYYASPHLRVQPLGDVQNIFVAQCVARCQAHK